MGCHLEFWQGRSQPPVEVWGRPGLDTFRFRTYWDVRVLIAGGGMTEMRSVTVSQSLLQSLLGDSFEAVLLGRLGLNEATKAVTRQMPQHLNAPLLEAMSDQYTGAGGAVNWCIRPPPVTLPCELRNILSWMEVQPSPG